MLRTVPEQIQYVGRRMADALGYEIPDGENKVDSACGIEVFSDDNLILWFGESWMMLLWISLKGELSGRLSTPWFESDLPDNDTLDLIDAAMDGSLVDVIRRGTSLTGPGPREREIIGYLSGRSCACTR